MDCTLSALLWQLLLCEVVAGKGSELMSVCHGCTIYIYEDERTRGNMPAAAARLLSCCCCFNIYIFRAFVCYCWLAWRWILLVCLCRFIYCVTCGNLTTLYGRVVDRWVMKWDTSVGGFDGIRNGIYLYLYAISIYIYRYVLIIYMHSVQYVHIWYFV